MIKWVEISLKKDLFDKKRFDFLSQQLKENGIDNQVDYKVVAFDEAADLQSIQAEYDQIRVNRSLGVEVVKQASFLPSDIKTLGSADSCEREHNSWWLRNYLFKALHKFISDKVKNLDADSAVLVTGTGSYTNVFVSAFIKLGFKKINIVSNEVAAGEELVNVLKRKYFGVDLEFILQKKLVTLSGVNGVMVNTMPLINNKDLFDELNYFNFMQKNGLVIDCNMEPILSELTKEAETIGALVIQGFELLLCADVLWANKNFNLTIDHRDYVNKFKNANVKHTESPVTDIDS